MAIIEANDRNFKELIDTDYAVVDFYGDHCGPCKLLAPNFARVSSEMENIRFIKFNVEHNPEITHELEVYGIPRLMFFRNGKAVVDVTGSRSVAQLRSCISEMLYD